MSTGKHVGRSARFAWGDDSVGLLSVAAPPVQTRFWHVNRLVGERAVSVATFTLEHGKVRAFWTDPAYRQAIERNGIRAMRQPLKPSDGRAFLDALEVAYEDGPFQLIKE